MTFTKIFFLLVASTTLLIGCKVDATSVLESQKDLKLYVYNNADLPLTGKTISPDSETYKELKHWISENTSGWSSTLASFAPSYLVQGETMSLNFQGTLVILNFEKGQYLKEVDPAEYDFLKK